MDIARLLDPVSLLIVFGGALAAACVRSTRGDIAAAFAAFRPLFAADPAADALAATRTLNRLTALAEAKGLAGADRVQGASGFLRRAAFHLADAANAQAFALWAEDEIEGRRRRHSAVHGFWRALADAAPAMGMIGTILGLISMFARMDDAAAIGPSMALALLTTFYGVVLSGAVAGPIAARLERLSEAELAWQTRTLARLELLLRSELDAAPFRRAPALRTVS